ncbi:MAG: XrtA-associated ATPase [Burkholderiaceae bacterium]|nr:XrtA-associated ATPase [Burkholderiaceae bacterium]
MYESFYGLTAKPFQLSPDPEFFFGSRGHRRAMAYLEYGLHQAEGFIVVTGEVGAGKTTLVQQLLRRLPVNNVVPVQVVTTQLEAEDLVRIVASSFGLPADAQDKSTLLIRLEQYLRQLHAEGKRALLIVDEAQNLGARAIEELRMLSNFQVGTKAILQSFLLGQPELRDLMQRPEMRQLKQRIIAAYHLGPLDRAETQQYIEHRLAHVGWKNDPAFDTAAFDRIFAVTHGIPRRINSLADRLLLSGFLAERHQLGEQDVAEVADELRLELGPRRGFLRDTAAAPAESERASAEALEDFGDELDAVSTSADLNGSRGGDDRIALPGKGVNGSGRRSEASTGRMADLEHRVEMLESATGMIFGALKKVLRLLRGRASGAEATERDSP